MVEQFQPIPNLSEILSEERRRIDCVENNAIFFNLYQKIVMSGKPIVELLNVHLNDIIGIPVVEDRHCKLSMWYSILRQQNISKDDLADLAQYLNSRIIYDQFKLNYVEDILEPVSRGRVVLNQFLESTSYKYYQTRFGAFYRCFENYLNAVMIARSAISVKSMDKATAQSYVDKAFTAIVKISVEDEYQEILEKLKLFREV